MVGNDISSAPAQRAAYSISAATSVSLTPGRRTASARSNKVAPSFTAARMRSNSSVSFTLRADPLPQRAQHRLARNDHLRAFYFFASLRVVANVRKEHAPCLLDQQEARAAGESAEISDVGEMADQERIKRGRGNVLPQFLLARKKLD